LLNSFLVLIQGWSCFSPEFDAVSFVSFYIELPAMLVMYVGWKLFKKTKWVKLEEMDLVTDVHTADEDERSEKGKGWQSRAKRILNWLF
jgi:AAT family amino acid transporter